MARPGTALVRCMHSSYVIAANREVQSPFYCNLYVLSFLYRAGKGRKRRQKTLKTLKRAELGVCKRWAMKYAVFSRRKTKKKKKDVTP